MTIIPIKIPQLGEGLQEARLVEFLKKPGDRVERDECIYVMETDKAISEIEATDAGTLVEWTVEADSVVDIGSEVGKLDIGDAAASAGSDSSPHGQKAAASSASPKVEVAPKRSPSVNVMIPPRTRKYLKEKNLLDVADQIPAVGSKLMPADVDRYLEETSSTPAAASPSSSSSSSSADYSESEVPKAQQTLIMRIARGTQVVLPAVLETELDWANIAAARKETKASGGPSAFAMLLWGVTQTMKKHPMLRSSMSADSKKLRTYNDVNLGVAVALEGDRLLTAVVKKADSMSQSEFFSNLTKQIEKARAGQDQVDASTTVTVSNIGISGMRSGIPLVVTPAVATIALGEVRDAPIPHESGGITFKKLATLTMSFDHRLLNGIGAANFLNDLRTAAAEFSIE